MSKRKHADKRKHKRSNGGATLADEADKYDLYERSVQCAEVEQEFFARAFRDVYGRGAKLLREDFCGTAAVSCEWVRAGADRRAYAVDLDPEPLAWGAAHNLARLDEQAQARVKLIEGDVRSESTPKVDIVAAQNFSFFIFKTRAEVIDYFRVVRSHLKREGIAVLDMFGGSEVMVEDQKDKRKIDEFKYIWEQARFDPITHHCQFYIHFRFEDGSKLERAFSYDWRLWSIPEVREMLAEAGFSRSDVYWEGTDAETQDGDGVYRKMEHAPSDPAWVSYVVAVR